MRILLTNDDGIDAGGLQALRQALGSIHELYIAAPEKEQSAMSHAITMHKPLHAHSIAYPDATAWAVNGTPADCAKLGIEALLPSKPQLVLSGINHGSNLGRDVFYSGTVSAAMEGMFLGIPSIALSYNGRDEAGLRWSAEFVCWWLSHESFVAPLPGTLYNVNIPNIKDGLPATMVRVPLGRREYNNDFHRRVDPRGNEYFWLAGKPCDDIAEPNSDVGALAGGMITLTVLDMEVTSERLATADRLDLPPSFS
ncbi:MAG: 5'/3'-nucleotidase SurE [Sulfobacillus sp.]